MKFFILLSLISFSLVGQVKTADKGFKVSEGMLQFTNSASFLKTYNYLISISTDEKLLNKWESENKFSSYRNSVDNIYEEYKDNPELLIEKIKKNPDLFYFNTVDSTYNELVPDKILATISNRKGIFKVGDEFAKVNINNVIKWKDKLLTQTIERELGFKVQCSDCPNPWVDTYSKILKLSNEIIIEKYKNDLDQKEPMARGNGPCKRFNEVAASQGNRKIKLQLFVITLYNNSYIVCGSHSLKNNVKYKTKHTLDIYSIKVQPPSPMVSINLTNYNCEDVRECTPVYRYLGTGSNYNIIQANIRATHRGMDGTYATFVCP